MSVAYYIAIDRETEFDPYVNGKYIARNFEKLNSFCKRYGFLQIDEFVIQNISEFIDEVDIPEQNVSWYDAVDGTLKSTSKFSFLGTNRD